MEHAKNISLLSFFTDENRFAETIWFFRRAVCLFLLWNTFTLLPLSEIILGRDSLSTYAGFPEHFFNPLLFFLSKSTWDYAHWTFIAAQILFLILGLFGKFQRVSAVIVFIATANLFYKAEIIANGGYQIILLMLFLLMFMDEKKKEFPITGFRTLNVSVSNFALIAARIQLALLYAFAGFNKLEGELWGKGEALYYALSTEEFSHPFVQNNLIYSDWFIIGGNYFAFIYQLLFPLLIWFNFFKTPMLGAGIILHLGIVFIMGLADFGFAMIACYAVFSSPSAVTSLKAGIRKISKKGD